MHIPLFGYEHVLELNCVDSTLRRAAWLSNGVSRRFSPAIFPTSARSPRIDYAMSNHRLVRLLCSLAGAFAGSLGYAQSPSVTTYSSAGLENYVVPAGVSHVVIKAWGAGGRGYSTGASGGAGGFVQGTFTVQANDVITARVGADGGAITSVRWTRGANVLQGLLIAGGGGQGADGQGDGVYGGSGGAGGGTSGSAGTTASHSGGAGGGGSQSAGGAAATWHNAGDGDAVDATSGTGPNSGGLLNNGGQGGHFNGATNSQIGGHGGAGYYGGGGGGAASSADEEPQISGGGAGGGSSYSSNASSVTNTAGSGRTPPNTSDTYYVSGKGYGGDSTTPTPGTGLVVILTYMDPKPLITSSLTASATAGQSFTYSITATNTPTSFAVSGTLPSGLSLNTSTGAISGTATQPGSFNVTAQATNASGTGSALLTLTVLSTTTPAIITQPATQAAAAGSNVTFSPTATGGGTLTYQWLKNGVPISGATSSTLTLTSVQAANGGGYSVVVTNSWGVAISEVAWLSITNSGVTLPLICSAFTTSLLAFTTAEYPNYNPYNVTGSYLVPNGVVKIVVKAWGAGGNAASADGGAGGFIQGTFVPAANDTFSVVLGAPPNGFESRSTPSAVRWLRGTSTQGWIIAGSGGSSAFAENRAGNAGGAGGGTDGVNASDGGSGGTQSGGAGTSYLAGGGFGGLAGWSTGHVHDVQGGPGGGGYFGGNAGSPDWSNDEEYQIAGGGGGGGSSYSQGTVESSTSAGSGRVPAHIADAEYVAGRGYGGQAGGDGAGMGLVVLTTYFAQPIGSGGLAASGTVGTAFSFPILAMGSPTSYSVSGTLPTGLSLNTSTGVLSGTPTQSGTFNVTVSATNAGGSTSASLALSITAVSVPTILTQPAALVVVTGNPAVFSVIAADAVTYQWRKNGTNISGATAATYTISSAQSTDAATYSVVVTNAVGSTTSANATLTATTSATTDSDSDGVPNRVEELLNTNPGASTATDSSNTLNLKVHRLKP